MNHTITYNLNNQINMKHIIYTFCLSFLIISCQETQQTDKEKSLLEKENELLKKENELLKKEKIIEKDVTQIPESKELSEESNDNLDFLSSYNSKYPREVQLLGNNVIISRINKFIGPEYNFNFINQVWQVEIPIEIQNGIFYAYGMQAHSGGDPSAVIMANIPKNILFIGIKDNGKVRVYSEDGSQIPQKLLDYRNGY